RRPGKGRRRRRHRLGAGRTTSLQRAAAPARGRLRRRPAGLSVGRGRSGGRGTPPLYNIGPLMTSSPSPPSRPFFLLVDDDPNVLSAVQRDIRARYGGRFDVVALSSGRDALEATRELKRRGAEVAMFLIEQRGPIMTRLAYHVAAGLCLLPARRMLLTALSDTSVAIQGLKRIGIHHYFVKPWTPR